MKNIAMFIVLLILSVGCSYVAPPGEIVKKGSGPYPVHYEAIIMEYLNSHLYSPETLNDMKIIKAPAQVTLDTDYPFIPLFRGHSVWEVYIAYDAKNRNGKYTGKGFHVAWIRHNRLVAYDYKDIEVDYAIKKRIEKKAQNKNRSENQS